MIHFKIKIGVTLLHLCAGAKYPQTNLKVVTNEVMPLLHVLYTYKHKKITVNLRHNSIWNQLKKTHLILSLPSIWYS